MRYLTGALGVLLLVIVIVFAAQNRQAVDVSFLVWTATLPKIFLILGTYLLGMLSGWGLLELLKRAF
jgi:uncharacterized integral membrane protein